MIDTTDHPATEHHLVHRTGWLRAAVLGANDGIISVSSLIVGVAAAPGATAGTIMLAGVAALVGGALSMAAGEYVSVSSQADTEAADLAREAAELARAPLAETRELAAIYAARGVEPDLARRVAEQMMAHDALGAHRRDELGLADDGGSKPAQAALFSALAFAAGAILPVLAALVPRGDVLYAVPATALLLLALLGALGARAGGAPLARAMVRVVVLGALAMGVTALIGTMTGGAI
ncbi:VIT1/CCC1 family predicted Fe2+/Mn2+ transporter [Sphingomonas endophytica]|uniref:VIT1/CCC1 family predicted Fe2+/Mn2+ transporter n=2 Tax=Sphingomonas endophytica TaxID=869719 RepID=A0A7X0JFI1_9SPHN|nr:VIT1/CCC1 transporter family protein [Sphingomonas endophytica]MBB6505722.1 VIT1/CCC1 family predicted Fe2+/Mn2+ transporter [Sphingomonas endophytica]